MRFIKNNICSLVKASQNSLNKKPRVNKSLMGDEYYTKPQKRVSSCVKGKEKNVNKSLMGYEYYTTPQKRVSSCIKGELKNATKS